jgi:hypothetical protein
MVGRAIAKGKGRLPRDPLRPVQAFLDFRRFGILPHAGGTFDQDAELMEDLRYVAGVVSAAEKAAEPKAKRPRRRS